MLNSCETDTEFERRKICIDFKSLIEEHYIPYNVLTGIFNFKCSMNLYEIIRINSQEVGTRISSFAENLSGQSPVYVL